MHVILIAAITADGYIARHSNETVSWSLDLHLFKKQTMGFPVIMGSNTKKTLNIDLSGRQEIVVHRQDDPNEILKGLKPNKCFVIGNHIKSPSFGLPSTLRTSTSSTFSLNFSREKINVVLSSMRTPNLLRSSPWPSHPSTLLT